MDITAEIADTNRRLDEAMARSKDVSLTSAVARVVAESPDPLRARDGVLGEEGWPSADEHVIGTMLSQLFKDGAITRRSRGLYVGCCGPACGIERRRTGRSVRGRREHGDSRWDERAGTAWFPRPGTFAVVVG